MWPDCDSCVSNACTWCDGVCASRCPAGVLPSPRCEVSCSGVFDCNQGGECIDTDVCECFAGFLPDTELGCLPVCFVLCVFQMYKCYIEILNRLLRLMK